MNKLIINGFAAVVGSGITSIYFKGKHKEQIKTLNTLHELRHLLTEYAYETEIKKQKEGNENE